METLEYDELLSVRGTGIVVVEYAVGVWSGRGFCHTASMESVLEGNGSLEISSW